MENKFEEGSMLREEIKKKEAAANMGKHLPIWKPFVG